MELTPELKQQIESMKQVFIREVTPLSKKVRAPHEEMMLDYYVRKIVELDEIIKTGIIQPFKTNLRAPPYQFKHIPPYISKNEAQTPQKIF